MGSEGDKSGNAPADTVEFLKAELTHRLAPWKTRKWWSWPRWNAWSGSITSQP